MEKAKSLREERKNGSIQDDDMTFKPQINQRPAYLDDARPDALDNLSANMSNDIFERPLPGKKGYQSSDVRPPLSPNSDALSNEMKKFSSSGRHDSSSYMNKPLDARSTYSEAEADETFLHSLRSDGTSSKHNRSKKPGWNDDFTTSNDILGGPPPPVKGRPPAATSTKKVDTSSSAGIAQTSGRQNQSTKAEWTNDWNSSPEPYSETQSVSSAIRSSPRSVMNQARSRLSLLKSKIRQSESGQGSRSSEISLEERLPLTRESSISSVSSNVSQSRPTMNINSNISPRVSRVPNVYSPEPAYIPQRQQPQQFNQVSSPSVMMEDEDDNIGEMIECPDCNRRFNPSSFEKHAKICAKVFMQKRKVFDSKKMRVADNPELVNILKKTEKASAKKPAANPQTRSAPVLPPNAGFNAAPTMSSAAANDKAKWKEQSNAFREAMKAARMVSKAIATGAPLPPPTISAPDPSLIPCPHCGRRFSEKAAERHIPKCSDIIAKPSVLKKGSNRSAAAGVASASKINAKGARF